MKKKKGGWIARLLDSIAEEIIAEVIEEKETND
jgi:hypothetical protein